MTAQNPLQLPEILSLIATHVPQSALTNCALVSKTWHQIFIRLIWQDITKDIFFFGPTIKEICEHCTFIKSLTFEANPDPEDLQLVCPNLESLTLPISQYNSNIITTSTCSNITSQCPQDHLCIIKSHKQISSLSIKVGVECDSDPIWNIISELRNLKKLTTYGLPIRQNGFGSFSNVCQQLESLSLRNYTLACQIDFGPVKFPHLQSLHLSTYTQSSRSDDLEIMKRCPELHELVWSNLHDPANSIPSTEFHRLAISNTWPHLRSLTIDNHSLHDNQLAEIIRTMKGITALRLGEGFGQLSFVELRPHLATVQELGLITCSHVTSAMVQEILSSCPLLTTLAAPRINAEDIATGKPWVCTELTQLSVCIEQDPSMADDVQPLIFEQLSRITRLEKLQLNVPVYLNNNMANSGHENRTSNGTPLPRLQDSIDLRLEKGLHMLSSLEMLRVFEFMGTTQCLGVDEVDWMLTHWQFLEAVSGLLNSNQTRNDELADRFREYGVII
ncbi:hypothetical protein BGZ76_003207 [Entomortierella beljakovae]|nr:hypothetical protein BGZ76_003207 [Entomortierella beljakovae]